MYAQYLLTPELFWKHFGLVGLLGLLAPVFIPWVRYRKFPAVLALTVILLLLLTYAKEWLRLYAGLDLGYHPTQHKLAKPIFLAAVILFALAFEALLRSFSQYSRLTRGFVTVCCVAALIYGIWPGLQGTWSFARVSREKVSQWQEDEQKRLDKLPPLVEKIMSWQPIAVLWRCP